MATGRHEGGSGKEPRAIAIALGLGKQPNASSNRKKSLLIGHRTSDICPSKSRIGHPRGLREGVESCMFPAIVRVGSGGRACRCPVISSLPVPLFPSSRPPSAARPPSADSRPPRLQLSDPGTGLGPSWQRSCQKIAMAIFNFLHRYRAWISDDAPADRVAGLVLINSPFSQCYSRTRSYEQRGSQHAGTPVVPVRLL